MALLTTPQISPTIRAGELVQSLRRLYFTAYNTTGTVEATAVTWGANDVKLSKNGAAGASTTNTPTQIDATNNPGEYYVDLTAAEALGGTAGVLKARVTNAAISTESITCAVAKTDGTILSGTATAGSTAGLTMDANAVATARLYMGCDVVITGGTGANQTRKIYYYSAARVATVWPLFDTAPDSTSTYEIIASSFPANVVRVGLAQASGTGSSSIALDTGASSVDGTYTNLAISVLGGTGAGITGAQLINSYTGSTRAAQCQASFNATPDGTSIFVVYIDTGQLGGQAISANSFATGAIASGAFAAGAISAPAIASNTITTAKITAGALTAACFGNDTTVKSPNTGTAQTGSTSSAIKLASAASATNDIYKGQKVQIISGTGAQQERTITAYDGTTKLATVNRNWTTSLDNTSVYTIKGGDEYQIAGDQAALALLVFTQAASGALAGGSGSVGEELLASLGCKGIAVTGTLSATTFSTSLTPTTNAFANLWVFWLSGALINQSLPVASVTSGGVITMQTAFTGAPANGDRFLLIGK